MTILSVTFIITEQNALKIINTKKLKKKNLRDISKYFLFLLRADIKTVIIG